MRPTSCYLIGPPGVGKTTVLRLVVEKGRLRPLLPDALDARWPLLKGQRLIRAGLCVGVRLGVERPGSFSGTDALSMSVHPQAMAWVASRPNFRLILGEGQRLTTSSFLAALSAYTDCHVVHLTADARSLAARRRSRRSHQDGAWLAGAATRASHVATALAGSAANVITIDTSDRTAHDVAGQIDALLWRQPTWDDEAQPHAQPL